MNRKRFSMLLLSVLVFVLVLCLLGSWLEDFRRDSHVRQLQTLESALNRSVLLCYALEGRYPQSLEELLSRCDLTWDRQVFYVDYRPMGGNLMPDITVVDLSGG